MGCSLVILYWYKVSSVLSVGLGEILESIWVGSFLWQCCLVEGWGVTSEETGNGDVVLGATLSETDQQATYSVLPEL